MLKEPPRKARPKNEQGIGGDKVVNRVARGPFRKVLLLGAAEAGKTTVLKQLRTLHSRGFSQNETEL